MKSLWQKEMTKTYGSSYSFLKHCDKRHNKKFTNLTIFFPTSPFHFLLNDNCFCCFLSNLSMNQPQVYICSLPFEPPCHLPPQPTPLGWYRAPVWVSWATQQIPLAVYFTHGNISVPVTLPIHLPLSSPRPCPRVYSQCLALHCCPVSKFFSTVFLGSIYMH